ncbi:MAG: peptidylprolyl isomerase [Gammaproteobacteria bacterium]|jgi:FKBP-type peptidyl-prolyl cis-trans isomerase SlyD|nr:peptidylprolyl isomerase [Gammaproteobacteria bacterium]
MRIANNCIVKIQFVLTNGSGQVLDRSPEGEPLEYLHGAAGILPELERHLAGKAAGETFDITITPDRGFGDWQPALVEVLPRSLWSEATEALRVGLPVTRKDPDGAEQSYVITAIEADTVTVDANHPLAGQTLRFAGTVVGVRAASAEELAAF